MSVFGVSLFKNKDFSNYAIIKMCGSPCYLSGHKPFPFFDILKYIYIHIYIHTFICMYIYIEERNIYFFFYPKVVNHCTTDEKTQLKRLYFSFRVNLSIFNLVLKEQGGGNVFFLN